MRGWGRTQIQEPNLSTPGTPPAHMRAMELLECADMCNSEILEGHLTPSPFAVFAFDSFRLFVLFEI